MVLDMEQLNTVFRYIYRDGSNYKNAGSVVFVGGISEDLEMQFRAALDERCYFIADRVRVPEVFFTYGEDSTDDDHCWHEFVAFEDTTDVASDDRTIEQFIGEVKAASAQGWTAFEQLKGRRI